MAKLHCVTVNGEAFQARSGQLVLDAALLAGIEMPHDCRAGRCGSCLTKLERGVTLGGETLQPGMIHACQARVFSDLTLAVEALPPATRTDARLIAINDVAADVAELVIAPTSALDILPGQYCLFTFRGFPPRAFSPTAGLDGTRPADRIHLNVKRVRGGRVSASLGQAIRPGHRLTVDGPFGHAFLRPQTDNRLILVAGGTGFAPMWAVAHAALCENPHRHVVLVAGVGRLSSLYMLPALELANEFPNVQVIATADEPHAFEPHVRQGSPAGHLPAIGADDVVYAAGAPVMVEAVGKLAIAAGAHFYSDPFEAAGAQSQDWITRAVSWLRTG